MRLTCLLLLSIAFLFSCSRPPELPEEIAAAYKDLPEELDYNIHVKPILSDKCFACHGPDQAKRKAGLRLDIAENAFATLPESPGKVAINPGNLEGSELFHRILSADPDYMMPEPDSHLSLSAAEKAVLVKWIYDGAVYKPHWAFVKPVKPEVPAIEESATVNPIDNFILDRLRQEKLPLLNVAASPVLICPE